MNSGTNHEDNPSTYKITQLPIVLEEPTRVWYTFQWWTWANGSTPQTPLTIEAWSCGDMVFNAAWTPNPDTHYTVEHYKEKLSWWYYSTPDDIDDLTGTTDSNTQAVAKSYVGFTAQAFSQTWIKWDWSTTVKIYYNRDTHTITFNTNSGTTIAPITDKYGVSITKPADPRKTGYTFSGWDQIIPTTMPEVDMTITAQWNINQYTITFNTDGGTIIDPITKDYNSVIWAVTPPTKTGYTFIGWEPSIPERMPAENITVNAQWRINSYEIRFRDSEHMYNDVVYTWDYNSSTSNISKPNWTKTGYTIHWDKNIPNPMPATGTLITATWSINQYTITFDANEWTPSSSVTQNYGT